MSLLSNVEAATQASQAAEAAKSNRNSSNLGKTIGKPQLSEAGAKYYEQLKDRYKDMDFILVSKDQKENAKANAAAYANPAKTVVLIDEEKIEKMATDEKFRNQYEGIIANAKNQLTSMKDQLAGNSSVKGFGIEVKDDGTTSLFAVLKDSSKKQAERIAKKSAEKKAQKREADKKADQAKEKERLEHLRSKDGDISDAVADKQSPNKNDNDIILHASSIDELMRVIEDYEMSVRSDSVRTEAETYVGQNIDFSL